MFFLETRDNSFRGLEKREQRKPSWLTWDGTGGGWGPWAEMLGVGVGWGQLLSSGGLGFVNVMALESQARTLPGSLPVHGASGPV